MYASRGVRRIDDRDNWTLLYSRSRGRRSKLLLLAKKQYTKQVFLYGAGE